MHAPLWVPLRHFLVQNSASRRHPLHVASAELAAIAQAVAVIDGAGQHIGDCLDAAMRVPGETGAIIVGTIVTKIVEQQEGIEFAGVSEAEGAAQLDAGALDGWLRRHDTLHGSDGH